MASVKEAYRGGIHISSEERSLGRSDFVESTLKLSEEAYDRRTQIRAAGIGPSSVLAVDCEHLGVDEKLRGNTARRREIARERARISYVATQELSIRGSEVAAGSGLIAPPSTVRYIG